VLESRRDGRVLSTAKPLPASITLTWRGDSGQGKVKLEDLHLAPFETRRISVAAMQKQLNIPDDAHWALVTLSSPAALPDDLMAVATSYDRSGVYGTESTFSDRVASHFADGGWQVDTSHNQLVAVTNGSSRARKALVTLHYDNGAKTYEIQQTVAAGDQLWLNFADLIRNRVPDRKGRVLPADLASGTYEVRDLTAGWGGLAENSLPISATARHRRGPSGNCCGVDGGTFNPGELVVAIDGAISVGADGTDYCSNQEQDVSPLITSWSTLNSTIASASYKQVKGLAAGLTNLEGLGVTVLPDCDLHNFQESPAPITVFDFVVNGNPFIYVGTDSHIVAANTYYAQDSHNGNPQPAGGTCCAESSDQSDVIAVNNRNTKTIQFTTLDQSKTDGDRTLTFEYTLSDGAGTSVQKNVTARQFAYLTNNNPSNQCTLGYGTDRTYTYTVYTHPDKMAIEGSVSGTPVAEAFNPAMQCKTVTGDGFLDGEGQFADNVTSVCSSAPLTCTQTTNQSISVGGYSVRTNTLQWTSTGVTYTSKGPTQ
jgi:hypothetical protein